MTKGDVHNEYPLLKITPRHAKYISMSSKRGKHLILRRRHGVKKYLKPVLVKHGLLEAEAAAFSTLY